MRRRVLGVLPCMVAFRIAASGCLDDPPLAPEPVLDRALDACGGSGNVTCMVEVCAGHGTNGSAAPDCAYEACTAVFGAFDASCWAILCGEARERQVLETWTLRPDESPSGARSLQLNDDHHCYAVDVAYERVGVDWSALGPTSGPNHYRLLWHYGWTGCAWNESEQPLPAVGRSAGSCSGSERGYLPPGDYRVEWRFRLGAIVTFDVVGFDVNHP